MMFSCKRMNEPFLLLKSWTVLLYMYKFNKRNPLQDKTRGQRWVACICLDFSLLVIHLSWWFTWNMSLISSLLSFIPKESSSGLKSEDRSVASTSCRFQKSDSCSCVQYVWLRVWAVAASSSVWGQLPWPECVPAKTHLWNHTTYSLWSENRPTAICLPLPLPSPSPSAS